jgi:hypothetical protein
MVMGNLAHVLRRQGNYAEAERLSAESLELAGDLDNSGIIRMLTETCRADVARHRCDYQRAFKLYTSSLEASYTVGYDHATGLNLLGLAYLTVQAGAPEFAATLFGALDAIVSKGNGALIPPVDARDYEQHLAEARSATGEEAFDKAHAVGRALSADQLLLWLKESAEL